MTQISFLTVAQAVLQIFMMGSIGFYLTRRGIINEQGLKLLSWISVNIAFPFFIFVQITANFNPDQQDFWWGMPLINIGLAMLGLTLGWLVSRFMVPAKQRQLMLTSGLHNAGYIPLLLATTLPLGTFTHDMYAYVILSIVGFDLCLWSVGVWLITQDKKGISVKNFINPPLVSMFLAFMVVLVGGKGYLSDVLIKPLSIMGNSALALAMLTIGGNLALTKFNVIAAKEVVIACVLKLLIMPTIALSVIATCHLPPLFAFILIIQSCMPTSITISIIARHHNTQDQDFINQVIFYSHLLSALTIPLFLGIYGMLK